MIGIVEFWFCQKLEAYGWKRYQNSMSSTPICFFSTFFFLLPSNLTSSTKPAH